MCNKHYMRQWYLDHPEGKIAAKVRMSQVPRAIMRDRALRYAYGVDSKWYAEQLAKQNGVCAICHKPETKFMKGTLMRLAVDHCHDTGKVRGLLCQACNRGIGCFNHDPMLLRSAIEYLSPTVSPTPTPEGWPLIRCRGSASTTHA
jgi:hypothetical protein